MIEAVMSVPIPRPRRRKTASVREAARRLGYSERYTKALIEKGVIGSVKRPIPGGGVAYRVPVDIINDKLKEWGADDGKLITPHQAADTLNVCVMTIYRYCQDGKLTPVRRGPNCNIQIRLREVVKLCKK